MTEQKLSAMLFTEESIPESRKRPDFEHIHRELAKSGVTLSLMWNEYQESCRLSGEIPFMYTQFCKYYREWAGKTQATMHIHHKPGEKLEVDWAGTTMALKDNITGGDIPVYVCIGAAMQWICVCRGISIAGSGELDGSHSVTLDLN